MKIKNRIIIILFILLGLFINNTADVKAWNCWFIGNNDNHCCDEPGDSCWLNANECNIINS